MNITTIQKTRAAVFERPHRGILFVPPNVDKMRNKIPENGRRCDCILLNTEDAIAANQKQAARNGAAQALRELNFGSAVVMARINGIETKWYVDDLEAILEASAHGTHLDVIMQPKVESADDIRRLEADIAKYEAELGIQKPVLIAAILETAKGVREVNAIAEASPRMHSIHIGPADLAASVSLKLLDVGGYHPDASLLVGKPPQEGEEDRRTLVQIDLWNPYVMALVVACRAAGILPIYGPFGRVKDYAASLAQFKSMYVRGCVGAWTLHPVQIDAAEDAFSPSDKQLAEACNIAQLMEAGEKRGDGAVMTKEGVMLDEAVYKQAANIIRLAVQIAVKDEKRRLIYQAVAGYAEAAAFISVRDAG